jgi:hypothetical protein
MSITLPMKLLGFVEIRDATSGELLVEKHNAIHFENMAEALALCLANRPAGNIHEMVFGNGASTVSGTGAITYFPPNSSGLTASLYNQTYRKIVDDQSPMNTDPTRNSISVQHVENTPYADVLVKCYLDFNEPSGQDAFDDGVSVEGTFVFDEIGLRAYDPDTGNGKLLSHVIFHPVQKSLNRSIEVTYTIRIVLT